MKNIMDNSHIHIKAIDKDTFIKGIALAFEVQSHDGATGYYITPELGFVFIWYTTSDNPKHTMFPFRMKADQAAEFAWQWLQSLVKTTDWQKYASHERYGGEVDSVPGWEIHTDEAWGHVGGDSAAICGIRPYWAWLGK